MAAVKGGVSTPSAGIGWGEANRPPQWEITPRTHWRRWFGYKWRKRSWGPNPIPSHNSNVWDWRYQTTKKRAREGLEEQFGPRNYDNADAEMMSVPTQQAKPFKQSGGYGG